MNPTDKAAMLRRIADHRAGRRPLAAADLDEIAAAIEAAPAGPQPLPATIADAMNAAAEIALRQPTADDLLANLHRQAVRIKHARGLADGVLSRSEPYLRALSEFRRRLIAGDPAGPLSVHTQRWPAELHRTLQLAAYGSQLSLNQFVALQMTETLTETAWRPAQWKHAPRSRPA